MATNRISSEGPVLAETHDDLTEGLSTVVRKLPDDPECLRISLGGTKDQGYYVVYRGDEAKIEKLFRAALRAFERHRAAMGSGTN